MSGNTNPDKLGSGFIQAHFTSLTEEAIEVITNIIINFDPDFIAFNNALKICGCTLTGAQALATNQLIINLKAASLWDTKLQAIYPFVGSTACCHKWNLKNPLNTDEAFRLTFGAGITHDENGITSNGAAGAFALTNYLPTTNGLRNDSHLSVYIRNNPPTFPNGAPDIGSFNGINNLWEVTARRTSNTSGASAYTNSGSGHLNSIPNPEESSKGFWSVSRTSADLMTVYRDGTSIATSTTSAQDIPLDSNPVSILGVSTGCNDHNAAFATIGRGLDGNDSGNLYSIVQQFQTALGREVVYGG